MPTGYSTGEGFYAVDPQGTATYQGEQSANGTQTQSYYVRGPHLGEPSAQHVCPACGYCPCCGRRSLTVDPYVPYYPPYAPIWITPTTGPTYYPPNYVGDIFPNQNSVTCNTNQSS
jgi:hypothetical protein